MQNRSRPRLLAALTLFALVPAAAQPGPEEHKASFVLQADRTAYDPGAPARVAALVTISGGWHVNSHQPTFEYLIPTELTLRLPPGFAPATVVYPQARMQTFAFADEPLAVYDGDVVIEARLTVPKSAAPGNYPLQAALRYQACDDTQCLPPVTAAAKLTLEVGSGGKANAAFGADPSSGAGRAAAKAPANLAVMLLLALAGGLILNAMPCVLPVLSLKVFGLVQSAAGGHRAVASGALATSLGILASFLALAAAAIGARSAGAAVGWGIQFQRPGFVAFLAVVVVLFCLNLWGLFEIHLPVRLAQLGGKGPREGLVGHFASGLFATLMATPCSAPFLGTAVGFALAQEAPVIAAMFAAIGVGMALPYLAIAAAPGVARLLPRPGEWMETLRGAMGFLLAGSAVWLFFVLAGQVSAEQVAVVQLGLLLLALFTWLKARVGAGRLLRGVAAFGMVAAVAGTLYAAASGRGLAAKEMEKSAGLIPWVPWDRAESAALVASGTKVFVDVTADWCFTCKINERVILDTPEVAAAFAKHGVVPMKADWTNRNDEIARFLAEHGKYGVPFYLLHRPGREPHVFSELPSKTALIEAVAR
jgi:suppressor for copper-sensitivity B